MSVTYSFTSLARAMVGGGFMQFITKADPDVALRNLAAASDIAVSQFEMDEDIVTSLGVSPATAGPILSIDICDGPDVLEKYLAVLAERLEESSLAGRLVAARDIESPRLHRGAPAVTAVFALAIEYEEMMASPHIYEGYPDPAWWVSKERTERALPPLVDWCLAGAGDLYFRSGIGLRITPEQALRLVIGGALRSQRTILTKTTEDAMSVRSLCVARGGELILQSYEPNLGWPAQLASLEAPLRATAPDVLNAFVRVTSTGQLSRSTAKEQPPEPPIGRTPTWAWRTTHLEGDYVPDAYGQQVITTNQLRRSTDLAPDRWAVEDLGDDRHLVTSQAPEDWFDADYAPYEEEDERLRNPSTPSATTLARARADFGDAILTPEVLDANPPPEVTGPRRT